jgi:hypothetical protein
MAWSNPAEVRKYIKCYALFTSKAVHTLFKNGDGLLNQVQNGQKSGADACIQLLNLAQFSNDRISNQLNGQERDLAMSILHNLNVFHMTWFNNKYPFQGGEEGLYMTQNVVDFNASAYAITRALFNPGVKYSAIVNEDFHYRAIRESDYNRGNWAIYPLVYDGDPDLYISSRFKVYRLSCQFWKSR